MGAILTAYSLSGTAGIRASLTMSAVGLMVHFGKLNPPESLNWVGSWWFICLASAAAVVDFFGDKIPALDHGLHALHLVLAPIAGGITAMSAYHGEPAVDVMLGVLGGGNALWIHSAKSGLRAVSSATTLGAANPVISILEDIAAAFFILIAVLVPTLTALLLALASLWAFRRLNRIVARRQGTA